MSRLPGSLQLGIGSCVPAHSSPPLLMPGFYKERLGFPKYPFQKAGEEWPQWGFPLSPEAALAVKRVTASRWVLKWSSTPHEASTTELHSRQCPLMCPEWLWVIDKLLSPESSSNHPQRGRERALAKTRSRGPWGPLEQDL